MMKTRLKTAGVALLLALPAVAADEPGGVLFADSFDSVGTFAENWLIERKTRSEGGAVRMEFGAGPLKTRVATPVDFVADVQVTLDPPWSKGSQNGKRGWAGIVIKPNYYFAINPNGTTFLVWRLPGEKRSLGKYLPIPGYAPGQPVHIRVIRKKIGEGVKYTFLVNGRPSGDFIAPVPDLVDGADGRKTYDPPQLVTYRENVEFDDFSLNALKKGDDSPNMITNAGFEFDEDGIPPFYCLQGNFPWATRPYAEYERVYLNRYRVDTGEKHSGKQSLRVEINKSAVNTLIRPWGAGTVKGKPGVFSVWMKASVDRLPVTISYGEKWVGKKRDGWKTVDVGRDWRRYEVTRDELPGRGIYSHVGIQVDNAKVPDAVLWIDDLQAETVPMPAGGFDPAKTYATKWMPADNDKGRFDPPPPEVKPPAVEVRRLPAGVRPTVDLDAWTAQATKVEGFYQAGRPSSRRTEGFLACDDAFLYVAYRCYGEKAEHCRAETLRRDDVNVCAMPSVETFFTPYGGKSLYQLVSDLKGNKLDLFASDFAFNGSWTSEAKVTAGGIDILQKFPLAEFAATSLRDRWGFNLCRNLIGDGGTEWSCTAKVRRPAYNMVSTWRELRFPAGVLDAYRRGPDMPPYGMHRPDPSAAKGRRRILGRLDFYMREPEARFRVFESDGRVTEHALDIRTMPCGTNKVTVAGFETEVVKLPYWKGATQINRWTRSIVHGGEGVLPTGFMASDISHMKNFAGITNITDFLVAYGFRHSMNFCHSRREYIPMGREFVRCSEARGIGLVVWGSPFFNRNYADMVDAATFVRELRGDNILSQLVLDEPELWTTSEEAKRQLIEMKKLYPYTPVQMNSTRLGIPQRFADLRTDILMLDDYLANNEGRTVWSVVENVDQMLTAGEAEGKPPWFFIESGVVSLHFKSPTYAEQTAQSWGCLAAGCTGIYWYEGFPTIPGAWRAMVDVNREVQSIKDVFLSEELCAQASSDVERKKVISLTKKHAGAWYVITCNLETTPAEVAYALPPDAPRNGAVDVLFENRTVPLASGRFTDKYKPLERHVYRISAK